MSTPIFNTSALRTVWSDRQTEMVLENHASVLFDYLCDLFQHELAKHYTALNKKCATANSKRDLEIPIWEYNTRYYNGESDETDRDQKIMAQGLHWMVGNTDILRPVPVRTVLRDTDVLARLAVEIFDGKHYELIDRRKSGYVDVDLNVDVITREIVMRFYPDGLSDQRQAYLTSVRNKTHARYNAPDGYTVGILNGTEDVPPPPTTPRQSPVLGYTTVPPVIRRVRAKRTLSYEDDEDYTDMPPLIPTNSCFCTVCADTR